MSVSVEHTWTLLCSKAVAIMMSWGLIVLRLEKAGRRRVWGKEKE
jgi:hypothetical protein